MATNQGTVGARNLSAGTSADERLDRTAALVTTDGHGRYNEAVMSGRVYVASTQAGVATSTALSTTQTGFTLTNPSGSGVNLSLLEITIACTTAPAAAATIVLAANVNTVAAAVTQGTPLTVRNAMLGFGGTGNGLAASATTLPAAPVVIRGIGGPVATGSISPAYYKDDVGGAVVLTPGTAVSINSLTTAISAVISMTWEELPI